MNSLWITWKILILLLLFSMLLSRPSEKSSDFSLGNANYHLLIFCIFWQSHPYANQFKSFKTHAYITFEECLGHGEILKESKMLMYRGTGSLSVKGHMSISDLVCNSPVWRKLWQGSTGSTYKGAQLFLFYNQFWPEVLFLNRNNTLR